ncbi:MAG TPA: ribonuclease HI family protein [Candidatus Wildermuthbacteria bacterium]|nr:ribonuclease HI family protein [Candidatus Wildermuthbacteria bacterium]
MQNKTDYIIYTDGGSRGNPGPSALGVVIRNSNGETIEGYGKYLGEGTNNEAEYKAPISGLKKLRSMIGKKKAKTTRVAMIADSELMVKQLNGKYKITDSRMQQLFLELWNLKIDFSEVTFEAVSRAQNKEADSFVNEALDAENRNGSLFT